VARFKVWAGAVSGTLAMMGGFAVASGAKAAEERAVHIQAMVSEGAPALDGAGEIGVWRLSNGEADGHVASGDRLPAELSLAPGDYRLMVRHDGARRVVDRTLEPGADPATWRIALNAGRVRLELRPRAGRAPIDAPLRWRVHRYKRGSEAGELVAEVETARPSMLLDAGWYEVTVGHNGEAHEHVLQVGAGEDVTYTVIAREEGT